MVDGRFGGDFQGPDNPYIPQHRPRGERPGRPKWYKNKKVLMLGGLLLVLLLVLYGSGALDNYVPDFGGAGNQTGQDKLEQQEEMTQNEKLADFIIRQKDNGVAEQKIRQKLSLAGYSQSEIDNAFKLADPRVQWIINEMEKGTPKTQIIDKMLNEGIPPEKIREYIDIAENKGVSTDLSEYWWVILLAGAAALIYFKKSEDDEENKRAPKVYTLEECREKAEEILNEKGLDWKPCEKFKVRPELRRYRYVYEEPTFAEFNNPMPVGNKTVQKRYYLVGIAFDSELVEFEITYNDADLEPFINGAPRGHETRGITDYSKLRERSEQPIEDSSKREPFNYEGFSGMGEESGPLPYMGGSGRTGRTSRTSRTSRRRFGTGYSPGGLR